MRSLEARGVELGWSERGAGPAVLLVHETATSSAAWAASSVSCVSCSA